MTMPPATPDTVADRVARLAAIRRRQILLAFEEHGPGYHRVTGNGARYVAEIVGATRDEWDWISVYAAEHPEVYAAPAEIRNPQQWAALRRQQGEAAFTAAKTACDSGDYAAAYDHLDEAHALGTLTVDQWDRTRAYVASVDAAAEARP